MAKDEIDIADLGGGLSLSVAMEIVAEVEVVVSAEAEAGEVFSAEVGDDGFEAIIAASGAFLAEAELAEGEIEVVADHEDVGGSDFVKTSESLDGLARIIVEILGFDEGGVGGFEPEGAEFGLLPGKIMSFGIKIEG